MGDKEIYKQITIGVVLTFAVGAALIFLMASVTYRYFGPIAGFDGPIGFQTMGLLVAIIIAHWVHRCLKEIRDINKERDQ